MENKIKVLTKDQTILSIPTNMAVRFGKLKKMLEQHEGSLINTTFDMQVITTKALDALIKCIEKRDNFLRCRSNDEELPNELMGNHGLCTRVDMETLADILGIFEELDINCHLNVSQNPNGACIDLDYDSYFSYEEN